MNRAAAKCVVESTTNERECFDRAAVPVTIVLPCLNEAQTLPACVAEIQRTLQNNGIRGEIIVANNGSIDGSPQIAERCGARVVDVAEKGYGSALRRGIAAARGEYVVIGDADRSYDFADIPKFIDKLEEGYDLVIGNRFRGGIMPGAMPALHRYLGNPVLSWIGRLFFKSPVGDFHCGLRAFRREAILGLDLRTTGMEFASEMIVKATLHGLRIAEVPTTLRPDGRSRPPHLRSWRDGWRHLRFMLMLCPRWLFLYPGIALVVAGLALLLWLLPGPRSLGAVTLDVHTLLYAMAAMLVGAQAIEFAVLSKVLGIAAGLVPASARWKWLLRHASLEVGLAAGAVLFLGGLAGSCAAVAIWGSESFGPLAVQEMLRLVIPSAGAAVLGCQVFLGSFFLGMLEMAVGGRRETAERGGLRVDGPHEPGDGP